MIKIKSFLICVCVSVISVAQTATDFTTNDCNGVSHNLFDSLDVGNVIVMAWVMPCAPCATYASYAYSAVQSFSISHPEMVDFYLLDDYANTSCASLVNWGSSNNMPLSTVFSSAAINMSDYGTIGMPKVVVLGSDHSIYYNENNPNIDFDGVQSSIADALSTPSNIYEQQKSNFSLSAFPNPANGLLNIKYESSNSNAIRFEIVNILGETVLFVLENRSSLLDKCIKTLDISSLEDGVYFLNACSSSGIKTVRFIVSD